MFSDPHGAKLDFLREARDVYNYSTTLVFIGIEHELSAPRVQHRVDNGGHDVPDEKLESRYPRTMVNLQKAISLVDTAFVFDNSSDSEPYRLVARYDGGDLMEQGYVPGWVKTWPLPGLVLNAE